ALPVAELDARLQLVPGKADLRQVHADLGAAPRAWWCRGQRLPHADAVLETPAESLVEADDVSVVPLDLEVHLGTAELPQALLGFRPQRASEAATLVLGRDRDAVEPAAMTVVARHRGRDDGAVERRHQEELALPAAPTLEDRIRRAPRRVVVEDAPP